MEKSQDALKTIGEMSKALDVQPHILRYWEEQFSILNPLKRAGGRRYYRSEDAQLLHEIHRLIYSEGYTIKGAQRYLLDERKISNDDKISMPATNNVMDQDLERKLIHIVERLRQAIAV